MQTQGLLQESSLASLLQTMQTERATGALALESENETASLFFLFGHLFHAAGPAGQGEDVVLDALTWHDGSFRFDPRAKLPPEETIKASPAELIAEAERRGPTPARRGGADQGGWGGVARLRATPTAYGEARLHANPATDSPATRNPATTAAGPDLRPRPAGAATRRGSRRAARTRPVDPAPCAGSPAAATPAPAPAQRPPSTSWRSRGPQPRRCPLPPRAAGTAGPGRRTAPSPRPPRRRSPPPRHSPPRPRSRLRRRSAPRRRCWGPPRPSPLDDPLSPARRDGPSTRV